MGAGYAIPLVSRTSPRHRHKRTKSHAGNYHHALQFYMHDAKEIDKFEGLGAQLQHELCLFHLAREMFRRGF